MITTRATASRSITGYKVTVAQVKAFLEEAEVPEDASLTVSTKGTGYNSTGYIEIFAEWSRTIESKK